MSSYNISEPSAIKRLKSDGKVVDDNGNVINEGNYWQKVYNEAEPKVDKILKSDGSIIDSEGNVIQSSTEFNIKKYTQAEPIPAKYLHSDGTIDENPGEGGSGANLQNNKPVNVTSNGETVVNPDSGYDGLKKVTVNVNVPSSGVTPSIIIPSWIVDEYDVSTSVVPNGVSCPLIYFRNSPPDELYILTGDGVKTVEELIFEVGSFAEWIDLYGYNPSPEIESHIYYGDSVQLKINEPK